MPITVTVPKACEMSGLGKTKLYELARDGRIQMVRIGRRTLVRVDSLECLLEVA